MHGTGWIDVIRRIPPELHDVISFATVNGSEIMVQNIVRLEQDFLLLRGRMAGSQDAGRVIVLPYAQIVNLSVNRLLRDDDVDRIFGGTGVVAFSPNAPTPAAAPQAHVDGASAEPPAQVVDPAATAAPRTPGLPHVPHGPFVAEPPAAPKPAQVSKSLLLARLRQRLAEQSKQ